MAKRNTTMVDDINNMFPPESPGYPVAFICEGETAVMVTSECYYVATFEFNGGIVELPNKAVDYYGEFRGSCPWIDPRLEAYAEANNGCWEWEDAGCVSFVQN